MLCGRDKDIQKNSPFFSLILLFCFALFCMSCSAIERFKFLKAKIDSTGWIPIVETAGPYEFENAYKFKNEGVAVVLCPKWQGYGLQLISIGPALFPLIPFYSPVPSPEWLKLNFLLSVGIEGQSGLYKIDLSEIKIQLPNRRVLSVFKASSFKVEGEFPTYCQSKGPDERQRNQIDIGEFVVAKDRILLFLEFDIPNKEIEQFTLDLGSPVLNGKNIKLPPLEYSKASEYRYNPFYIPRPS